MISPLTSKWYHYGIKLYHIESLGSVCGRAVRLLAKGQGFEPESRNLNFRDWVSTNSKLRYDWTIIKVSDVQ